MEPTIQWRFGRIDFGEAAGVLFTVAGQHVIEAIHPNLSIDNDWSKTGAVLMRRGGVLGGLVRCADAPDALKPVHARTRLCRRGLEIGTIHVPP